MAVSKLKLATSVLVGGMLLAGVAVAVRPPGDGSAAAEGGGGTPVRPPPTGHPGGCSKVRELKLERVALLRQIADSLDEQHRSGGTPLSAVLQAYLDVTAAELELDETDEDRIRVLEKRVAIAREVEKKAAAAAQEGSLPTSQILKAKVNRLNAEIELERAKAARRE